MKENSMLLIIGTILALFLANIFPSLYELLTHVGFENDYFGHYHDGHYNLTLKFVIDEILMSLFFFVAGKEVWESITLSRGSLRGKKALSTLVATFGGLSVPILVYLLVAFITGSFSDIQNGWAIPTATDIAFAYLVGRMIFGAVHPALNFLLAVAIIDDLVGIVIIAMFYPSHEIHLSWLLLSVVSVLTVFFIFNYLPRTFDAENKTKKYSEKVETIYALWPYVLAGVISWFAFYKAGIHPALGLLPIIPAIPHAEKDFGFFSPEDEHARDLLNRLEHLIETPVEFVLFGFGLMNAGVVLSLSSFNEASLAVSLGLIVGKTIGVTLFGLLALRLFGLPDGMSKRDLPVLGAIAGIGFTVALFVSVQAFEPGVWQDGAKVGALLSFGSALVAFVLSKILKTRKISGFSGECRCYLHSKPYKLRS